MTAPTHKQLLADAKRVAARYHKANDARAEAVEAAKASARQLAAAGVNEVELAALFNVDRARTIRRWLGKMD